METSPTGTKGVLHCMRPEPDKTFTRRMACGLTIATIKADDEWDYLYFFMTWSGLTYRCQACLDSEWLGMHLLSCAGQ